MQKFNILDPSLDIFQNHFLEASAGTGKTFAIEHLVCRLILESEEPILLSEILAVTFTKEAAFEMKTRIRKKLEALSHDGNRRVREALAQFDDVQIFTIHGFCHRMLTEFAFEAKIPLQISSPDKPDHLTEMAQVVQDFLRTASPEFEPEISTLLKGVRYDIDRLIDSIVASMSKPRGEVAKECAERWRVKATRSDQFTFDDLLKKMQAALNTPLFLEKVRAKYKAAIVDEFQDTDPVQWRIFEKLFLNTHHLVYLVGDPKQSIYGFRNADIYTYMNAANALGVQRRAFLDTNFRSSPELIEKLNHLFTERPEWISLPSLPQGLQYHPVKAGRLDAKLQESPIHYFGVKGQQGRERNWPTKQMEEEKLFPFIASEMIRLNQSRGVSFSQMAVLIKDRFQAQRLQLHFNLWKIPSSIKQTFNLVDSRGFAALENLLRESDKEVFDEKGFGPFFAKLRHGDPTLYLEMRQTAEILMEHGGTQIEEHLHLLQELKRSSPEIDERLKLRGEEGDLAPIMTTFGSKGLEFEVVFALAMASRYQSEGGDPEKQAEKMRQLYVAFTRSREKLYIPILYDEAQKAILPGGESPNELFFTNRQLPIEWVDSIPIQPRTKEALQTDLEPPTKPHLNFQPEYLTSFTAMSKAQAHTTLAEQFQMQDLSDKTPHTLPLGAETGVIIHTIFENYFQDRSIPLSQIVFEVLNGTHLESWESVIEKMVEDVLEEFNLNILAEDEYFQEMEFLFPKDNELIKGFVDLVFKRDDHFYIVDWKTNWLGPADSHYTQEKMHAAMAQHDYNLQAKLYGEALERYVKRFYKNPKFGGAYYIFVRGKKGVHVGNC